MLIELNYPDPVPVELDSSEDIAADHRHGE